MDLGRSNLTDEKSFVFTVADMIVSLTNLIR